MFGRNQALNLFFATDLHGSERCFRKLVAAAKFYEANVLVLGGDLVGKELIFVRKGAAGKYEVRGPKETAVLSGESELREYQRTRADAGVYTKILYDDEEVVLNSRERIFEECARNRLEGWVAHARDKLCGSGVTLIVIPGNDDAESLDDVFDGDDVVVNVDRRVVTLNCGLQFAGLSWCTPTPWNTHREYSEEEIGQALSATLSEVDSEIPLILNVHVPPYGSGLDTCAVLDKDLKPVIRSGGPLTAPVGSRAVKEIVLSHPPLLGLFGHVHEARSCTQIGGAMCVNPGSDYSHGKLLGFLATIKKGKVVNWLLTEG